MTDLEKLRDAVQAGEWPSALGALRSPPSDFISLSDALFPMPEKFMNTKTRNAWSAYLGSVDAALAFVAAVLPGWWWKIGTCSVSDDACVAPDFNCPVHGERLRREFPEEIDGKEWPEITDVDVRPPGNPARALLLAALNALIAMQETK